MMQDSTLATFMNNCPLDLIARRKDGALAIDKERHNVRMYNGSIIKFRSSDDPDKIRGMECSFFWHDEGGQEKDDEMWKIGIGRMSEKHAPQRAICTTTPNGLNWLYDFFVAQHRKDTAIFYATTEENQLNLPPGYVDGLKQQYSGSFYRQELLGQFVGFEGLVYRDFNVDVHVTDDIPPYSSDIIVQIDAGLDFGYTNPTAMVVVGRDRKGVRYVYDEFYESGKPFDFYRPEINRVLTKYNVRKVYCDPSSPGSIDMLNSVPSKMYEAVKGDNDVMLGIMQVAKYLKLGTDMRPRIYVHPRCKNLINEFQLYRYSTKRDGEKNRSEVPIKKFDHALDALRYVLNQPDEVNLTDRFMFKRSRRNW
jgi:PBSX family phage terminase large subunit